MSKTFQIDIITPTSITSISDASYLRVPSIDGLIGIQSKHANAIIALDIGEIKISDANGKNTYYATSGGFADINLSSATSVTLLGPSVTITLVLQFAANALAAALEDRNVWFNMKLASSRFT